LARRQNRRRPTSHRRLRMEYRFVDARVGLELRISRSTLKKLVERNDFRVSSLVLNTVGRVEILVDRTQAEKGMHHTVPESLPYLKRIDNRYRTINSLRSDATEKMFQFLSSMFPTRKNCFKYLSVLQFYLHDLRYSSKKAHGTPKFC